MVFAWVAGPGSCDDTGEAGSFSSGEAELALGSGDVADGDADVWADGGVAVFDVGAGAYGVPFFGGGWIAHPARSAEAPSTSAPRRVISTSQDSHSCFVNFRRRAASRAGVQYHSAGRLGAVH